MRRSLYLHSALFLLVAGCATPGEPPAAVPGAHPGNAAPRAQEPAWSPAAPTIDDGADWIRLTSGEWLRGEIDVLRYDSLEFDSVELDDLKLDWADVAEVYTTRSFTCSFEGHVTVVGALRVRGSQVLVGGEEPQRFTRDQLVSFVPGEPSEQNYWSGGLTMGSSVRRGNTDQTDASGTFLVRRRTAYSRVEANYDGNFSEVRSVETANSHRLNFTWDRFTSRDFYVTPFFFEAFNDRFQNIALRFTPGVGAGYHLVDRAGLAWDVNGGLGYQFLEYDSVQVGEPDHQTSTSVILGTSLDYDLTEKVELLFEYSAQIGLQETAGTDQHLKFTISVDLIGEFDLDVGFIWDRVGMPVPDSDGNLPDNDDFRLTIGIGWDF